MSCIMCGTRTGTGYDCTIGDITVHLCEHHFTDVGYERCHPREEI